MVLGRQKVWTDGIDGRTDEAKTISLQLRRGIINILMSSKGRLCTDIQNGITNS